MPPKYGLTGFNPAKYAAASGTPANDPWKRVYASPASLSVDSSLMNITVRHGDIQDLLQDGTE